MRLGGLGHSPKSELPQLRSQSGHIAVTLKMAELGEATVNRILHEKSCSEEEFLKELLNSRNNEEIINHLEDSNRPREEFQVLQNTKNHTRRKDRCFSYLF